MKVTKNTIYGCYTLGKEGIPDLMTRTNMAKRSQQILSVWQNEINVLGRRPKAFIYDLTTEDLILSVGDNPRRISLWTRDQFVEEI